MKKWFAVVIVLLIGLLVSCSGSGDTGETVATSSSSSSSNSSSSDASSSETSSDETSSDETSSDETSSDEAASSDTSADEASSSDSASSDASSSETSPPAGPTPSPTPAAGTDPETGLEINPNPAPQSGEFIVMGPVGAVNAIPQDKPTFTIRIPGGASYTIHAQPISEIFVEDGSQLLPHEFRSGLLIKATVQFDSNVAGGTPGFVTDNLVIMLAEE